MFIVWEEKIEHDTSKILHPTCITMHWAPPCEAVCVLQCLQPCTSAFLLNFLSRPYSVIVIEPSAACLGLCLEQHAGAVQSQQTPRCFHQVLGVPWCIEAGISLHAGAAQRDISASGVGRRAAHPPSTQRPPRRMAASSVISKSWDV